MRQENCLKQISALMTPVAALWRLTFVPRQHFILNYQHIFVTVLQIFQSKTAEQGDHVFFQVIIFMQHITY